MLVGQRRMHATPLFRADGVQFAGQSLVVGPSLHHEAAVSAARTIVREAEEGKGLGAPVAAGLPSLGRESTEFQESRFIIVQRQAKRDEARPKGDQHLLRVRVVLKAHHKVVGVAHDDDATARVPSSPLVDPQVKHVVQEDIRE